MANFSTACGRVTLKSPPSRAFFVPDVHTRLRKHLARCTLDCGFQTSESPALRGFVAERAPIRGTSLYLVLKSNGLRHSKNSPVKFGFSSKTVPANIAKKLPPQRCFKPLLIALFNFSHKRLTRRNRGLPDGAAITTLDTYCTFTNIPGPGIRTTYFAAFGP